MVSSKPELEAGYCQNILLTLSCEPHYSPLDGSAAVRGGVPIVFPVFGPPDQHADNQGLERVPRHGIARTSLWRQISSDPVDSKTQSGEAFAKASFGQ